MKSEQVTAIKLIIANWLFSDPKKTEFYAREIADELGKKIGRQAESLVNEVLLYCQNLVYEGTLWAHPAHTKRDTVFTVVQPLPFLMAAREADENTAAI